MCTREMPTALKEGLITPLFKSGNRGDSANYQPVTLTFHIIKSFKTFERVICGEVMRHLEGTQKLLKNQHCFRSGKSCVSQLLQYKQCYWKVWQTVQIWMLFTLVSPKHLIRSSQSAGREEHQIGTRIRLIEWMASFQSNRTQTVEVKEIHSSVTDVLSDAPREQF